MPNHRLYWSTEADTRNLAVMQCGLTLNRFEALVRSLHFVNNFDSKKTDRIFKIRNIFDHFNKKFLDLAQPLPMYWAIDEAMEPYYGRHGLKQYIRGKPVRFGYKFWCLCSCEGYLMKFKLYEGRDTGYSKGLYVGESVVKELALGTVPINSHGYVDNYFTTIPLLDMFSRENIFLTGTIRKDRIKNAPLIDIKRKDKGYTEAAKETKTNIVLCHWKDNNDVIVATNTSKDENIEMNTCRRYCRKISTYVNIPQPKIINDYNKCMGGVDLFDQFRGKYRTCFRKRVWYYPLFRFILNATVSNGWILYRKIHPQIRQLDFLREIVNVLLKPRNNPKKNIPLHVRDSVRYDRIDHMIVMGDTQRRCGVCKKNVKPKCAKCDVALHVQCFNIYHTM